MADLLATYERLKAAGIEPYWPIHHGISLSLYYEDPDGNHMEFQVDGMYDYMEGDAFHANPVGVNYDPDALVARWKQGASEAELLQMPAGAMAQIRVEHGMV